MSALLSSEAVTIITHVRIDIFVSDRRLLIGNADLVKRLVQSEVRHDRRHNGIIGQLAFFL